MEYEIKPVDGGLVGTDQKRGKGKDAVRILVNGFEQLGFVIGQFLQVLSVARLDNDHPMQRQYVLRIGRVDVTKNQGR